MSSRRADPLAQVSDFDIRLLRIFRSVVECGGFSAAETVLGIGRSAISQQMSDLEQRVGLRLCQRGRAGFSLTEEGARSISRPCNCSVPWKASVPRSTACTATCAAN